MAMLSNKSPSLVASSRTPNARNSEINNPMRRSFGGNPFTKPSIIANPRSFNPYTPTNSPSDFPRRKSVGAREKKSGFFPDLDNKENEKDQILKPGKVLSPAASKGTKNFMSPTISAYSKFTESPRKNVLIERNDPRQTSISLTDAKSPIRKVTFTEPFEHSDMKPGVGLEEKKPEEASLGKVPKEEKKEKAFLVREGLKEDVIIEEINITPNFNPNNKTKFSVRTVNQEHDYVNLDLTFKLSTSPRPPPVSATSTVLAPFDVVDPLLPPYDPETNYLSPRPQFLHYKPNPRVELYKEREGINLEDSLISGSFSDTEVTEEETQSESSKEEVEDVSSVEASKEEDGPVYETSPTRILVSNEAVEAKEMQKPHFFMRSKAIALLLLLSVACLAFSVMNSPVSDPVASEVLTIFSKAYQSEFSKFAKAKFDHFSEFAKEKFDDLAQNFLIWFANIMSLISDLIANFREVRNSGHFQFSNMTALDKDIAVDLYPSFGHGGKGIWETSKGNLPVQNFGENDAATKTPKNKDVEDISVEHYDSLFEEFVQPEIVKVSGDENVSGASESVEIHESNLVTAMERPELEPDPHQTEVSETNYSENNTDLKEDQPNLIVDTTRIDVHANAEVFKENNFEVVEIDTMRIDAHANAEVFKENNFEVVEIQAQEIDAYANSVMDSNVDLKDHHPELNSAVAEIHTELNDDQIGHIRLTEVDRESASVDAAFREQRQAAKFPPRTLLYLTLFLVSLIGAAALSFSKKNKNSARVACFMEQPQLVKTLQMHVDSSSVAKEHISLDKPSFRNGPTEMDVLGESYPSEMSSYEKSSSYGQRVKEVNEVPSLEQKPKKNYRRASLASSSSMGDSPSPSYGSFTTYEKLPIKHEQGDEKTITPVRRSSRIRNQATSPL